MSKPAENFDILATRLSVLYLFWCPNKITFRFVSS